MKNFFTKWLGSKPMQRAEFRQSYYFEPGSAIWMDRNYDQFSDEAYIKNVIAHRAINLITQAAVSIPFKLFLIGSGHKKLIKQHPVLDLLSNPNPNQNGKEFLECVYMYRQIAGNAFILSVNDSKQTPMELYTLRPDRVSIVPGASFIPNAYHYKVSGETREYKVDHISGRSQILHIKNFHPLSDWYGLSSIEAAAYSIDQHNQAGAWNQALLQNGARPSGAIMVRDGDGNPGYLTNNQYQELKRSIDEVFCGAKNAGRPILLEGNLEWKEMSLSPKDMDFIESKNSAARDIALAFGVPPQLLGIPGDNTYSNLQEARLALWEQTIIPMVENVVENLSNWLNLFFKEKYELTYDLDSVQALSNRRDAFYERINNCSFMTTNEKRIALGLEPVKSGDIIHN